MLPSSTLCERSVFSLSAHVCLLRDAFDAVAADFTDFFEADARGAVADLGAPCLRLAVFLPTVPLLEDFAAFFGAALIDFLDALFAARFASVFAADLAFIFGADFFVFVAMEISLCVHVQVVSVIHCSNRGANRRDSRKRIRFARRILRGLPLGFGLGLIGLGAEESAVLFPASQLLRDLGGHGVEGDFLPHPVFG